MQKSFYALGLIIMSRYSPVAYNTIRCHSGIEYLTIYTFPQGHCHSGIKYLTIYTFPQGLSKIRVASFWIVSAIAIRLLYC